MSCQFTFCPVLQHGRALDGVDAAGVRRRSLAKDSREDVIDSGMLGQDLHGFMEGSGNTQCRAKG